MKKIIHTILIVFTLLIPQISYSFDFLSTALFLAATNFGFVCFKRSKQKYTPRKPHIHLFHNTDFLDEVASNIESKELQTKVKRYNSIFRENFYNGKYTNNANFISSMKDDLLQYSNDDNFKNELEKSRINNEEFKNIITESAQKYANKWKLKID